MCKYLNIQKTLFNQSGKIRLFYIKCQSGIAIQNLKLVIHIHSYIARICCRQNVVILLTL